MSILVPMDFTEVSLNALKYALDKNPDGKIHVVHVSSGLLNPNEPLSLKPASSLQQSLLEDLDSLLCSEFEWDGLPENLILNVLEGETIPMIQKFIQNEDISEMILGTRDKYDVFDRWIGTISLGLVKTLEIPIYLIPRYSTYQGFKHVLIASDYHLRNQALIKRIRDWNTEKAFIKFLHIQHSAKDDFTEDSRFLIETLFEEKEPDFGFEITRLVSGDIVHSLLASAYNFKADLLIAIPENQSFIQSLLFKSLSKELILKSDIPILFLPNKSMA